MKNLSTLLLCLLLTACGTIRPADPDLFTGLEVQPGVQGSGAVAVVWVTYDSYAELWEQCKQQGVLGCAYDKSTKAGCLRANKDPSKCKDMLEGIEYCVIMTLTGTSYALLGHEVRHCFHGKFHD